jgi:signal peptidase I
MNPDPMCWAKRIPVFFSGGALPGPRDPCTTDYIKRVVGLPGDTIQLKDDVLYVNGTEQPRTFQTAYSYQDQYCGQEETRMFEEVLDGRPHPVLQSTNYSKRGLDFGPVTVPEDNYFMMGDNRDNSADSRAWGFVPRNLIKGRAVFVWLSLDSCADGAAPLSVRGSRIGTVLH